MVTRKTGQPIGRPTDFQKRAAIIDAAWTLFLQRGVEGVSLEAIAGRAAVSKVTLYKHFADKSALFVACMQRECERIEASQSREGLEGQGLQATLRAFGVGLMTFLISDPAVDFYNALSGELRRHEDLARLFYDFGPGRTRANLAAILRRASETGELDIDDAEEAAEHLFGLWQGFSNLQLSLGVETERIERTLSHRVDRAIEIFVRAYAKDDALSRP